MIKELEISNKLAQLVKDKGGRAFFVGGYVRDIKRGIKAPGDIDIEVHGISADLLREIIDSLGERIEIGQSFGVFGIKGYNIDIALPRKESLIGSGHRDFHIVSDPFLGTIEASRRRDFTINAMMSDILTGELVDHFGGVNDIENKLIRHVDDNSFGEDPLRALRACGFASRFQYEIAEETIDLCKTMDLSSLSPERVFLEVQKALLYSEKPSLFFIYLRRMNQLDKIFPELSSLIGLEQNPVYHSEGDVFTHTMMVIDSGAKYKSMALNPLWFMLSLLTHDFGKAVSTTLENGVIHSYGHATKGLDLVTSFLRRITNETKLISYVTNMVENHMKPGEYTRANSRITKTNKMFDSSSDPRGLIYIGIADGEGKIPRGDSEKTLEFLLNRLDIYNEMISLPEVRGEDLLLNGIPEGKHYHEILKFTHKLHLEGVSKDNALKQAMVYYKSIKESE